MPVAGLGRDEDLERFEQNVAAMQRARIDVSAARFIAGRAPPVAAPDQTAASGRAVAECSAR